MHWFLALETPTPSPQIDESLVTPGVVGFVATFLLIVATILILIDMNRRTRRVRYRAEIAERLDAEEAAAAAEAGDAPDADEAPRTSAP